MHASLLPRTTGAVAQHGPAMLVSTVLAVVSTHALAGPVRAAWGLGVDVVAPIAVLLTVGALAIGVAAGLPASPPHSVRRTLAVAGTSSVAIAALHPVAWPVALTLVPAAVATVLLVGWGRRRGVFPRLHEGLLLRVGWSALALVAVVQFSRLGTHVTDPHSDWFLTTRNPFFAQHECLNAYLYAAELDARGEPNIYDAAHYPGLDPAAKPQTTVVGMTPEDPYQYPPQFLLLPHLALSLSRDYPALRSAWFGINVISCLGVVLALAAWAGGPRGQIASFGLPLVCVAFPVLHDFQYGQFHFAAIALSILGLMALEDRRTVLGGALLAAGIVSKVFPALLLIPLAWRGRWRELVSTGGALAVITAVAWPVVGTATFEAFVGYQLPRLSDGSAFAFGEAWPEIADLVVAGNQGAAGVMHKLTALGVVSNDSALVRWGPIAYGLALLGAASWVGLRSPVGRGRRAVSWLSLLGLASLVSTGAWADYVPLTGVWVGTYLWCDVRGRRWASVALGVGLLWQMTALGSLPLGEFADPDVMVPVSLLGAFGLMGVFVAGLVVGQGHSPASS